MVAYRLDALTEGGNVGCLLDISLVGMRVRFKQALDMGATHGLSLVFPRWLELGSGIDLAGRFVWVRAGQEGATDAGFAFDKLSRKQEGVLTVLIQRLSDALCEDTAGSD